MQSAVSLGLRPGMQTSSRGGLRLKQSTHVLRETWRRRCFDRFLHNPKRHDAAHLRAAAARYDEKQVAATRILWRKSGAEGRGVLVGAAHSTAEYARMQGQPVPRVCCLCHSRIVPSWEHLLELFAFQRGQASCATP